MATRIKPPPKPLYEQDVYVWSRRQADLLRARRCDELDLEHLIEETDDLGGAAKKSVRSLARTIIEHLLKVEHSPAVDPRPGWRDTIWAARDDLSDDLTPSLRRELGQERMSSTRRRASGRKRLAATTARPQPPTRFRRPASTRSTGSRATGCRTAAARRLTTADLEQPGLITSLRCADQRLWSALRTGVPAVPR